MLPSFIVTFREILEIALILGVILAATNGLVGRSKWIFLGLIGGIIGSAVVAAFTETISNFAEGIGQELFNAMILLSASIIIGWTALWMKTHAREMMKQIKEKGGRIVEGDLPKITISIIITLAVLREGSEIVLFTYGMLASGQPIDKVLLGSAAGTLVGAIVGLILYFGLISIPTKYIFKVTTWLLIFLSAGMSSMAAKYLASAGYFTNFSNPVWNMSNILSENSIPGQILHALFGYSERPMSIQLIFYFLTLGVFTMIMTLTKSNSNIKKTVAISTLAFIATISASDNSFAGHKKVYSPYVEQGELELEYANSYELDNDKNIDGKQKNYFATAYGVTNWWATEIVAVTEESGVKGSDPRLEEIKFENRFQLTEKGQYPVDLGLYLEYEAKLNGGEADKLEAQILLAKDIGKFTNYANIEFAREVGENSNDDTEFAFKWSTRYRLSEMLQPGFEYYAEFGELGHSGTFSNQEHQAGPVFYGDLPHGFGYEVGYLAGLSDSAPDGETKLIIEYEKHF